jgi:hypothetical protein
MPTGFKLDKSYAVPIAMAAREDHYPLKELKHRGYLRGFEAGFTRNVSLSDLVKEAIDIESSGSADKSYVAVKEMASAIRRCGGVRGRAICVAHGCLPAVTCSRRFRYTIAERTGGGRGYRS